MFSLKRRWSAALTVAAVAGATLLSAAPASAMEYQQFTTTVSGTVSVALADGAIAPAAGVTVTVFRGAGASPWDWDSDFDGIADNLWWSPGGTVTTDAQGHYELSVTGYIPDTATPKVQLWVQPQVVNGVSYKRVSSSVVDAVEGAQNLDWTLPGTATQSVSAQGGASGAPAAVGSTPAATAGRSLKALA